MKIIAITGTKGKTSIARIVDFVLKKTGNNILRVDTDGCFYNGKLKYSAKKEYISTGKLPTAKAGKYLQKFKTLPIDYAVFEQSISSGKENIGLGYKTHDIAILTNIYYDHINYRTIKSRGDIYNLKLNIIKNINSEGYVILNFDDYFCKSAAKQFDSIKTIFYGTNVQIKKETNFITIIGKYLHIKIGEQQGKFRLDELRFPFDGSFSPMLYNMMASISALILLNINVKEILEKLKRYKLPEYLNRLIIKNKNKRTIVFDTAHEPFSIIEVGKFCKTLGRRVTAVLRLKPSRPNRLIDMTGERIAKSGVFDNIIIYDFIDGKTKKLSRVKPHGKTRGIGEVAEKLYFAITKYQDRTKVKIVLNEQDALKEAYKRSKPKDVILMILHDYRKDLKLLNSL